MKEAPAFPPVDAKLLDEVVARIRSAGDPRRVVLFGSHAHGRGRPDSDLDLLIVEDSDLPRHRRAPRYLRALVGVFPAKDVIVWTPSEIAEWSRVPHAFISTILREGVTLYERCYAWPMSSASHLSDAAEAQFWNGVRTAGRFFMGEADVQKALEQLARVLDAHGIPYAIVGAMALNEFGYQRTTVDVNVLLTPEGLAAFKAHAIGRGYIEKCPGSRGVRDTAHHVDIDVVLTGTFPGDGKPKPVVFPDPATAALRGTRVALLPLPTLVELKLASGMTAPHRLKDLADVQELIRIQRLPRTLVLELNAFVRDKYLELWEAVQEHRDE